MKLVLPILMAIFIGSLFINKYLEKYLNKGALMTLKIITVVLIILTLIGTAFIMSTNFSFEKNEYGWHVKFIDYANLHKYSRGKSQKIALIDSGISQFQINKDDKNSTVLVGDSYDNNGHGTMMYSIIKGYNNQVYGIAPDVEVLSIKVMDKDEKLSPNLIVDAIKLAIEQKSTIINLSIGSYIYNQEISDVIGTALNNGITIVSSSGDYQNKDMMFPANKPGVISVGSLSANNKVSDFTNAPSDCTIIAPGDEIKTINNKKAIEYTSGTSQATAVISGYIALLKDYSVQKSTKLTNDEVISILKSINSKEIKYIDGFNEIK